MVQISNADYANLVHQRDAFAEALKRLAEVTEAFMRQGEDCVPARLRNVTESDVAEAIQHANGSLCGFGDN